MQITTRHLGPLEFSDSDVIHFEEGIPSFESETAFILVPSGSPELPFHYLQSIKNTDVAFIVTDPFIFVSDYDFDLPDEVIEVLQIKNLSDVTILSIATIVSEIERSTLNLVAPVVINHEQRLGKQVVLQGNYPVRHFLFDQSEKGDV